MKKYTSLFLVLTLVLSMAIPTFAATYSGRFARDDTYNDIAYLAKATCQERAADASLSYASRTVGIECNMSINTSDEETIYRESHVCYNRAYVSYSEGDLVTKINVTYKVAGNTICSAHVVP